MQSSDIQFFAWSTHILEPMYRLLAFEEEKDLDKLAEFQNKNLKGIQEPIDGILKEMRIVGRSKYVIKESLRMKEMYHKTEYLKKYTHWEIFNIVTGEKVYEIDNLYESE